MFKIPAIPFARRTVEPALRSNFSEAEVASMARLGTVVYFGSGETLMAEGAEGTDVYFITNGSAAVSRGDRRVAVLQLSLIHI